MPHRLLAATLFTPDAPPDWAPLLADLQRFITAEQNARNHPAAAKSASPDDAHLTELRQLHDRLLAAATALHQPEALRRLSPAVAQHHLALALALTQRLAAAVLPASLPVLDTAGSRTLRHFTPDFPASTPPAPPPRPPQLPPHLFPDLSPAALAEITAAANRATADAHRTDRVLSAWRTVTGLHAATAPPEAVHRAFVALYPDAPTLPGEVHALALGSLVLFTLPIHGHTLAGPRWLTASPELQADAAAFVRRVLRRPQRWYANFPAFGTLDGPSLSDRLVAAVAAAADVPPDEVRRILPRCVTIVAHDDLEKYAAHDAWGHSYQSTLLNFEHAYRRIATFADPLPIDQPCTAPGPARTLSLRAALSLPDAHAAHAAAQAWMLDLVATRLADTLHGVVGELTADVAEFKLARALHAATGEHLPSSSFFPHLPAKLDFTLRDLRAFYHEATKALRAWGSDPLAQHTTALALAPALPSTEAADRTTRLAQHFLPAVRGPLPHPPHPVLQPLSPHTTPPNPTPITPDSTPLIPITPDSIPITPAQRLALAALATVAATNHTVAQVLTLPTAPTLPTPPTSHHHPALPQGYLDLVSLAACVFYQANPAEHFWLLGEFLLHHVAPFCTRLAHAGAAPPR